MAPLAEPVIDWAALWNVVWASLLGGIGVTAAFALALHGGVRALDARRDGRTAPAYAYWVLMAVGAAIVLASVVFAIVVITSKQ